MASVLLLALAGFFLGGVWSFWRGGRRGAAVVLGVAALLALAGAVAWAGA
ncbi:MAG TPA: hypothetical protein VFN19_10500 [Candidatus Nanopelagicales bacterium]|nr:hypothetical protein [Candidatus Nanopelagicales bacterium]